MSPAIQHHSLRTWLEEAPFGLTLSSGFFGFFAHCGVVSALDENHLKPASLSGSSAGALVAGLWAAGLPPVDMQERLFTLDKADFWDPAIGAGYLRGQKFRDLLADLLPARRFTECGIKLALSATDLFKRQTHILDQGELAPAIYASCCVPIMFQPIRINDRLMVDGGVTDRPGLAGMQNPRVLYHHLAGRSPWRSRRGAQTVIPARDQMISVVINPLPRVGPKQLQAGKQAFEKARSAMLNALDQPLIHNTIRL